MAPINNMYDWLRHMRKVRRWSARGPEILALRGAELVRAKPSELKPPEPKPTEEE